MGNKDLDRSAEELSALMDGEVSELELRRVLNSIEQDQELCRKWSRYHLASAAIRRQTGGQTQTWLDVDISSRVLTAIEDEPVPAVAKSGRNGVATFLSKPIANVAVAAFVSAAVILGWQNFATGPSVPQGPAVASSAVALSPVTVSGNSPLMAVSQTVGGNSVNRVMQPEMIRYNPELDDRLNYYLLSHSSNAAVNTAAGVTPYARVVTVKPSPKGAAAVNVGQ